MFYFHMPDRNSVKEKYSETQNWHSLSVTDNQEENILKKLLDFYSHK